MNSGRAVDFRLVTVPHTGTVFTRGVLAELGFFEPGDYTSHHTDERLGFPVSFWAADDVVVTVRDPIMAEISRLNRDGSGQPVEHWSKVVHERDNVWYFRVDGPVGARPAEIAGLAAFLGVEPVEIDWSPVNTTHDKLGLKAKYAAGEVPKLLEPAFEWLSGADDVQDFFERMGCNYRWMR